ncbi:MAG: hypothetical protein KatS3mg054_0588 [Chloroflexus sp.]|nr:MAG: hypothetical protein KatS3mg054_0588 [Chloroflexus sp.]
MNNPFRVPVEQFGVPNPEDFIRSPFAQQPADLASSPELLFGNPFRNPALNQLFMGDTPVGDTSLLGILIQLLLDKKNKQNANQPKEEGKK